MISNRNDYNNCECSDSDGAKTKKLADLIMERIAEKKTEIQTQLSDAGTMKLEDLDPRVKEMYEGVRDVMKKYRSGKVPKAFKIIPKLRNWEQILYVTEPHNWSAAAMYQGTRMFSSILTQHMAQRFYNLVLLPRIRDDLGEYRKLNAHLYRAMQKSLFKPAAFMKGVVLPLLEVGRRIAKRKHPLSVVLIEIVTRPIFSPATVRSARPSFSAASLRATQFR